MDLKQEFQRIVAKYIQRDGIDSLMEWINTSDFYTAPASTRYHGSHEGGLVMHSLNVYAQLRKLCEVYGDELAKENGGLIPEESLAIVALFHDLCKVGTYRKEVRWRKNDQDRWEQYETYTRQEDFHYGGHGSKSVYLVQYFMKLTPAEAAAINCHMGQWEATQYGNPSEVYGDNVLAWLLHVADEAATYTMDD